MTGVETHPVAFEYEDIYRMSYTIYPIIGMVLTVVFSIAGSLVCSRNDKTPLTRYDLVHPLAAKLFKVDKTQQGSEN